MSDIPGKRVLIVKTSSLGDIILGLRVAKALKDREPSIRISWVSRRRFRPIVDASGLVEEVFTFYRTGSWREFWGLLRRLRRERFDYVLDMQGLARSGMMCFATKSPIKVGRSDAREGATLFYDRMVPMPKSGSTPHALEILLEFCRVFGFEPTLSQGLEFSAGKRAEADWVRREEGERLIVIFPGKGREDWDWSGYEELATRLLEDGERLRIVFAGIVEGRTGLQDKPRFLDLRGKTSLDQAGDLAQRADLVVSNEVAPLQLAAAVGTPSLGIFGPVDPCRFGAFPSNSERHGIVKAPGGRMSELGLDAVLKAAQVSLAKARS